MKHENSGTRSRLVMLPGIALLLAIVIIALTAYTGIRRGMDHKVAFGPQSEQWAITIALSETVYGLKLGYVGFSSVFDKLAEVWNRGATGPFDLRLIDNSSNADLLNEALQAAASLGPQKVGYISDGTLITTYYDDMGQVDFDKIAFKIFGLRIQSLYYLFFAIVSLSALIYIASFHNDTFALVTLLATLLAFYIELYLNFFSSSVPTFPGMRHGSTLALIPMWYFVFLSRRRASVGLILGALAQLAILILAWRIRGSVSWMFVFVFTIAFGRAVRYWLRVPREARSWSDLIRGTARWPVLVLLLGAALNSAYARVMLHPVYFTDDILPYHGAWHSAYLGLQYSPELLTEVERETLKTTGGSDTFGYYGTLNYLDRIHFMPWNGTNLPPGFLSPWTNLVKARFDDEIARRAVLRTLARRPLDAFALYVYKKPIAIFQTAKLAFTQTSRDKWMWLILAGGIVGAILLIFLNRNLNRRRLAELILLSGAAVLFSALPNLWAYAGLQAQSDTVLSFVIFLLLALSAGAAAGLQQLITADGGLFQRPFASAKRREHVSSSSERSLDRRGREIAAEAGRRLV